MNRTLSCGGVRGRVAVKKRYCLLRVDVDFFTGLKKGVPALLDDLEERGLHAGFYVVMGPDTMHRHAVRVTKKGYLRRLLSMNPLKIMSTFGPRELLLGSFLPPRPVGPSCPEVLRRIADEGHDLGVHGYDHYWWAENVYSAEITALRGEIDRGWGTFRKVTGRDPVTWASPNWRTTDDVVRYLASRNVPYLIECRGRSPFFTLLADGHYVKIPHLPISLPALHELRQLGLGARESVEEIIRCAGGSGYNMLVIHDYYEGLLARDAGRLLLDALIREGFSIVSPSEYLKRNQESLARLPSCRLSRAHVGGGIAEVSYQCGGEPT
jgi:peptidoglycan/xylan/chitin deacetylase (PgdA/CDA1 family)